MRTSRRRVGNLSAGRDVLSELLVQETVFCGALMVSHYTSQQDFGTRKVYCVSNVPFHAESKYAIKIFSHHPQFLYNGLLNY